MAAIEITGITAFIDDIERQKLRVLRKITAGVKAVAEAVMVDLVNSTPQYSGNLVLNWHFVFGPWSAAYRPISNYGVRTKRPYQRAEAVNVTAALDGELFKLDSVRWNTKIKIVNSAPYASEVESGQGPNGAPIRDVNKINGAVVMGKLIEMRYQLGGPEMQSALQKATYVY